MAMDPKTEWHNLLFGVRKSIRYHVRRRRFFENWNTVTMAVALIFSSAAVASILGGLAMASGWRPRSR